MNRAGQRLAFRTQALALQAWGEAVDDAEIDNLIQSKEEITQRSQEIGLENERLRRDNERFVRLIDSGEWGRGRVEELSQVWLLLLPFILVTI